jgi:hypothetical protein
MAPRISLSMPGGSPPRLILPFRIPRPVRALRLRTTAPLWGALLLAACMGAAVPALTQTFEWTVESVPTRANLRAIWGSSPSEVFAVGDSGTVLHFDGTSWTKLDFPFGNVSLIDVHGSSASDVYAVGGGQLYRYDGAVWSAFVPQPGAPGPLTVWSISPNEIICAGNGFMKHWDGAQWNQKATFYGFGRMADIWGVSGGDLFAVDDQGGGLYRYYECQPGYRAWEQVDRKSSNLRSLWGSGPSDVWAVGGTFNSVHYTGDVNPMCRQPWSYSGPAGWLNGVWGRASDDIWAVGHYAGLNIGSYIVHFDGSAWRSSPAPEGPAGPTGPTLLQAVWGDRSGDFWAVGDRGHVLRNQPSSPDTTLVVNSTRCGNDTAPGDGRCETGLLTPEGEPECTLCAAIQEANADASHDLIEFDIPTSDPGYRPATGSFEIAPPLLPTVTAPVTIDGTTQPGSPGRPRIDLRPGGSVGLWIRGGASTVRGLAIRGVQGTGLVIDTQGGNTVTGCYIGTDVTGLVAAGNQGRGISISHSADNTIGGLSSYEGNVIAGNSSTGIVVTGTGSTGNRIIGNIIGLAAGGDQALPNGFHGILVDQGASGTMIGGADPAARNLISSNADHGIAVAGARDTRINGNTIGLDRTGRISRGNGKGGIVIEGAAENSTVGGTGPGDGNLIAGNLGHGIDLHTVTGVAIHRNHVGLDVDGTTRLPNVGDGIRADDATGVKIGDGGELSGNKIAANTGAGLRLRGATTRDVIVQHNRIGYLLSPDTSKAANDGGAIRIEAGVEGVSIGGTDLNEWNRIYGSVTAVGATTRRISFLGNHLAMPASVLEGPAGLLPFDLGGDGPSCHCWGGTAGRTNDGVAAPRLDELTTSKVEGMSSPGATVFAYRVLGAGSSRMRYFFHALEPQGHAVADGEGRFTIPVALAAGDQVVAAATDADGNTSEMSQLKRPIVFVHGIGGAWLEASDGTSLWLPAGTHEAVQNDNLRRMSFNADGTSQEAVTATEMLESVFGFRAVYGPIMDWLESHGYRGESRNLGGLGMDAWRYWYDWRRSPADAVAGLKTLIDRVTADDPNIARSCEVDLVAHSNGGVVSNVYIRGEPEHSRCRVNRYITMGIPVLGTPLAAGAHTRGYIFGLEKEDLYGHIFAGGLLVRWGWMIGMARNLPAGYALMPGEAFWPANRGNQPNHYLEDLNGTPLASHQRTVDFMAAPKVDAAGLALGLDRNLAMWTRELQQVHARADDWSDFRGPPRVLRIVGQIPNSTIQRWTLFGDPPSRLRYAFVTEAFSRYEPGDTYDHWSYRERLTPVLGAGDGTVLLSSATLGHQPAGGTDYSGLGRSPWIGEFRYFPCKHNDLLIPKCTDGTLQCLQYLTDVLHAGYRVPPAPEAARVAGAAGAAGPGAAGPGEILYVRGSEPVSVRIEDGGGTYSGPPDPAEPDRIVYELEEVGYWSSSQTACLTYDPAKAYTITISALDAASDVQVLRILSDGATDNRNIYFPRTTLAAGGSLRLTLPAGGAPASAPLERDAGGDGVFEATVPPAATATSTSTAPAIPLPKPFRLTLTGYRTDTGPRRGTLHLPDVGGPVWSWSTSTPPAWLTAAATSGGVPDSLVLSFSAPALAAGVYEDTLSLTLGLGGYAESVPVPVRLEVLESPTLARIALTPSYVVLRPGETQAYTAAGYDQAGDAFGVTPAWEAEGGSITPDGVFTAGAFNGLYFVTARSGGVESEALVEIVGGAPPVTTPVSFALHQNFPNPFADGTTIAFDLPEPARVRIRLFDLRGRQVATLVDADYGPGRHQQALGALPLTGGVYFYRAEMGSYTATRKMLVVR